MFPHEIHGEETFEYGGVRDTRTSTPFKHVSRRNLNTNAGLQAGSPQNIGLDIGLAM